MLYMVRSAVCIGVVVWLAAGDGQHDLESFARGGREAARSLGRACIGSGDCLRMGTGLADTLAAIDAGEPAARPGSAADESMTSGPRRVGSAAGSRTDVSRLRGSDRPARLPSPGRG